MSPDDGEADKRDNCDAVKVTTSVHEGGEDDDCQESVHDATAACRTTDCEKEKDVVSLGNSDAKDEIIKNFVK